MSTNVGDAFISIGGDLGPLKKAIADAQKLIQGIKPVKINIGGGGGGGGGGGANPFAGLTSGMDALQKSALQAKLAAATLDDQIVLLRQALLTITPNTVQYNNVLTTLHQTLNKQSLAQLHAATAAKRWAETLANATLRAELAGASYAEQIRILNTELAHLARTTKGTVQEQIKEQNLLTKLAIAEKAYAREVQQTTNQMIQANLATKNHTERLAYLEGVLMGTTKGTLQYARALAMLNREQAKTKEQTGLMTGALGVATKAFGFLGIALGVQQIVQWGVEMGRAANKLEQTQAITMRVAGSTERYADVVKLARDQQVIFGNSLAQNIDELRGLVPLSRTAGVELRNLAQSAQVLSTLDTAQGVGGATIALREFLTAAQGDSEAVRSLTERFEGLDRDVLKAIVRSTGDAETRLALLNGMLADMGLTFDAVTGRTQTAAQGFTNLANAWSNFTTAAGGFLTKFLSPFANILSGILTMMRGEFSEGRFVIFDTLNKLAVDLGLAAEGTETKLSKLFQTMNTGVPVIAGNTTEFKRFTTQIKDLEAQLDPLQAQMDALDLTIKQMQYDLYPFEQAVEDANDAVAAQREIIDDAEAALQPYRDAVDAASQAIEDQQRAIRDAERALKPFEDAVDAAKNALKEQQDALRDAEDALKPYEDAVKAAQDAVDAQRRAIRDAERALEDEEKALRDAERAVRDQERALEDAEEGLEGYRDAVDAANRAVDAQQRVLEEAEKALRPYEEALQNAQRAVAEQQRKIELAERALRPYEDAVQAANDAVEQQQRRIEAAERALRPYTQAVEESQRAVEKQQEVVNASRKALDDQNDALEEAKTRLQEWANVPLEGTRAFETTLFEIDQQVAALQLRLLDLRIGKRERRKSPLEEQLAEVNRQVQETALRLGRLRTSGTSEGLVEAEALYRRLRSQQDTLSTRLARESPINDPEMQALEEQIAALNDQSQRTRLVQQITQAPQQRALEQLGRPTQEMTFDQIVAGYQRTQTEVESLTGSVALAQAQWEKDTAALNAATTAHMANVAALEAQEAALVPMNAELERLQDAAQRAADALEAQQRALVPLHDELVRLQDVVYDAQLAFDAANAALEPLRQELDRLREVADAAKVALENADAALDPMREELDRLKKVAEAANDALQEQIDLIQPLKDALIPLEIALETANDEFERQNALLDPLREKIEAAQRAVDLATDAYNDANEAIDPLRESLDDLAIAEENARQALEARDDMIDPHREKLRLLEENVDDVTQALKDEKDAIDPLIREQARLGISQDIIKGKINDTQTALEDFVKSLQTTPAKVFASNSAIHSDMLTHWNPASDTSNPGLFTRANTAMRNKFLDVWGRTETEGIQGDMKRINDAMRNTWLRFWGTSEGTGIQGDMNRANVAMKNAWDTFWGVDDESGVRGFFWRTFDSIRQTNNNAWGTDDATGIRGDTKLANAALGNIIQTQWGMKDNEGIRGYLWNVWNGEGGEGGIIKTISSAWETIKSGFENSKELMKDAVLAPFEAAADGIWGVMKGFGNSIASAWNSILSTAHSFSTSFIGVVNQVSRWLIGENVIPVPDEQPPTVTPMPETQPGLARGTDYWGGGWARTGEEGRELALLPRGTREGNLTYLPPGSAVLPHEETEELLRRRRGIRGLATGANTGFFSKEGDERQGWGDRVDSFLDWFANGTEGLVRRGMAVLGVGDKPDLPAGLDQWESTIGTNYVRFGMRRVYNVANAWLHSVLPKAVADAISGGLQQGGDYWGFLGRPEPGATGPGTPGIPTEVGSSYPWGIGLNAALNAIIPGGYVSGHRFSVGHPGLDIASRSSDAIRAIIGGTVIRAGYNPALEGQYIVTQDPAGRGAYYGHMVPGSDLFARGDTVGRGSTIGTMGSSGLAEGKHIHFELRVNGISVNPEKVFAGTTAWPLGPDIVTVSAPTQTPQIPVGTQFVSGTPASAQQWIVAATRAAGVGDDWIYGMSVVGKYESGFSPTAIAFSRDDYNAQRNQHSRGIAQTIPQTYNQWKLAGSRAYQPPWGHVPQYGPGGYDTSPDTGDIYDPIANFAASIRYIAQRYGHVNRLPGVASVANGGRWIGYADGGIINEPIIGYGLRSGQGYTFGEHAFGGRGQEIVIPVDDTMDRRNGQMLSNAINSRAMADVSKREDNWNVVIHQHEIQSERSIRDEIWTLRHLDVRG